MHLQWKEAGAIGTNAIVGGGVPLAAGFAWAHRQAGTDAVAVTYFGDGAINIGSTLETMNLAAAWKLPVCFFIENNQYAVSTTRRRGHRRAAAVRARPGLRHPPAGRSTAWTRWPSTWPCSEARRAHARRQRPDRRRGRRLPLLPPERRLPRQRVRLPRRRRRRQAWRERDPLDQLRGHLVPPRHPDSADVDEHAIAAAASADGRDRRRAARADARRQAGAAADQAVASGPTRPASNVGVRGDLGELDDAPVVDRRQLRRCAGTEPKFIDAVAERDGPADGRPTTRIVVMGEDVHRLNGGTNGATRGLPATLSRPGARHPDQRERLHRPRRRHRAGRPLPPGRRVHVRRLHVGRRRPAVQPDRQGPAHVRRRRTACRSCCAARSRWAPATARSTRWTRPASSPPPPAGGSSRPRTPVRLRRPDEHRAALRGPGRRARARRPLRLDGPGPGRRLRLLPPGRAGGRATRGLRRHRPDLPRR